MYLPKSFSALKGRLHTRILYTMLGNEETIAWLTPHTAVARDGGRGMYSWEQLDGSRRFFFLADGKEIAAFIQ
jgi:hypothetical protein